MADHGEHPLDADDGTKWIYSPGLKLWTGWVPGEDGCWTVEPEAFERLYPEVVAAHG